MQQLADLGYISKDSRNAPITLTHEGEVAAETVIGIQNESYEELLSCLDDDERERFIDMALRIFESIEEKGF